MTDTPSNELIVIKVGGGEGNDLASVCDDAATLHAQGKRIVLIHGGSHETNLLSEALGHPPQFITSPSGHTSRRTDRKTLEIFEMAYCGKVNKAVVEMLQQRDVNAVGLSGIDGRLWRGKRKAAIRAVIDDRTVMIRDDFTGTIESVNTDLLRSLLDAGYMPVLTPPAISHDGEAINVDADRAAGQTAVALGADTLLLLSNVPGLMKNFPDESSLIDTVAQSDIERVADQYAQGRMKKKVMGAREALEGGVSRVIIGDSRLNTPITAAITGKGTTFTV